MTSEDDRAAALIDAQRQAAHLFERIAATLIRPGVSESRLTREIGELAERELGVKTHWHKRVVRAGANTLCTFYDDPPEATLAEDDIVFIDLGPVFAAWEADFGRTYVLGQDPHKLRLRDDVAEAFAEAKRWFEAHPAVTGAEFYAYLKTLATRRGWESAGPIAGHLVGEFAHKSLPENMAVGYANESHHEPMRGLDSLGRQRHWILEVHFVDRQRKIGAFFEELLTVG